MMIFLRSEVVGGWLSVAVEFEADLSGDLDLGTRWDWAWS